MKISVLAKTKSKVESVEEQSDGSYQVRVRTPPIDGKANEKIIELLAEYFDLSKSQIRIVAGKRGKKKIFELVGFSDRGSKK
ncbi:MAG: DUF167 domain-containing protein [Oligoflexia bacterium]|nr:DUF167 domain-containing protein [Oligoflexia bacterium]